MKPLSDKQLRLLKHMANGASIKGYAFHVGTSPRSVAAMITTVCKRLGAENTAHAVHIAWQKGILE